MLLYNIYVLRSTWKPMRKTKDNESPSCCACIVVSAWIEPTAPQQQHKETKTRIKRKCRSKSYVHQHYYISSSALTLSTLSSSAYSLLRLALSSLVTNMRHEHNTICSIPVTSNINKRKQQIRTARFTRKAIRHIRVW